eukprot:COSAG01_NODE_30578_length_613_cov_1.289883_1_plen_34_part_01
MRQSNSPYAKKVLIVPSLMLDISPIVSFGQAIAV